jgi:ABC-type phosphate transport system permease subunit
MKSPTFASESTRPSISRPPSTLDTFLDRAFRGLTFAFAWLTIVLMVYLLWRVGRQAAPAIQKYGLHFLTSTTWDVNKGQFGVLPEMWGTLYSSLLALLLGGLFGVAIAIFLTQDFGSDIHVMLVKRFCATVGQHRLPSQQRSTEHHGHPRCVSAVSVTQGQEKWSHS